MNSVWARPWGLQTEQCPAWAHSPEATVRAQWVDTSIEQVPARALGGLLTTVPLPLLSLNAPPMEML